MIAGLESITAETLLVGEQNVTHLPPKNRNIAMVFQSYALFPHLNVRENVAFGMKIRHSPKEEIAQKSPRSRNACASNNIWTGSRKPCPEDNAREWPWRGSWSGAPAFF
jgi:ABC-type sugar transport system ATPase subunit